MCSCCALQVYVSTRLAGPVGRTLIKRPIEMPYQEYFLEFISHPFNSVINAVTPDVKLEKV